MIAFLMALAAVRGYLLEWAYEWTAPEILVANELAKKLAVTKEHKKIHTDFLKRMEKRFESRYPRLFQDLGLARPSRNACPEPKALPGTLAIPQASSGHPFC